MIDLKLNQLKPALDDIYNKFNGHKFISPDPLEFLYHYSNIPDREIVGLIASSLAYGRVEQICISVSTVLKRMPSPSEFLTSTSPETLVNLFSGFKHRFTNGEELSAMIIGVKRIIENHGSLESCFMNGLSKDDETILPALEKFVCSLKESADSRISHLLPSPKDKSACKRLNLFLKWMVRCDNVDPGGWRHIPANKLIAPVDVHIHRICRNLGITKRKTANLRTAIEITNAFKQIAPDDPVKYDFALTRLVMRNDGEINEFYHRVGVDIDAIDA